jgi:hypothetical protein
MNDFVKEYVEKINERTRYMNSVDFDFDVIDLKEYVDKYEYLHSDDYDVNVPDDMKAKLIKVCDALLNKQGVKWDTQGTYATTEFNGLFFSLDFGQGSSFSVRKIEVSD